MGAFASPLFAAAALIGLAGIGKILRPSATRVALRQAGLPSSAWEVRSLGLIELAIAAGALVVGGAIHAALVAAAYLGFAWFAHRLDRATRGTADCGCFGTGSAPVGPVHVGVNLALAVTAIAAVAWPTEGIDRAVAETPWSGVPFVALTALLTWMLYVSLTVLPTALAAAKAPTSGGAA